MARVNNRSLLGQYIAEILNPTATDLLKATTSVIPLPTARKKPLVCGSIALLAMSPVQIGAVGLGEINLHSGLGQPLQASVPVKLGSGESLAGDCVAVRPQPQGNLRAPQNPIIETPTINQPGNYSLKVSTAARLYEPMYALSLQVDCPGVPLLVRHYILMLDLPGMAPGVTAEPAPSTAARESSIAITGSRIIETARPDSKNPASGPISDVSRDLKPTGTSIPAGTDYRVREGDTLSTIAARVQGRRPNSIWTTADQIFAGNRDAFIRDNPDLIKLGTVIQIPDAATLTAQSTTSSPLSLTSQPLVPETPSAPEPMPAPLPVATSTQAKTRLVPDVAVAVTGNDSSEQLSDLQSRPESQAEQTSPADITQTDESPATESAFEQAAESTASTALETSGIADTTPAVSPFVDESPAALLESNASSVAEVESAVSNISEPAPIEATSGNDMHPLVAIVIGLLLGLGISFAWMRRNLLDAIVSMIPLRKKNVIAGLGRPSDRTRSPESDSEYATEAREAFIVGNDDADDVDALPIQKPAEETYIVDIGEAGSIQKIDDEIAPAVTQDVAETLPETVAYEGDTMLAQLFEDDLTAEAAVVAPRPDSGEITAEMPTDNPQDESNYLAALAQMTDDDLLSETLKAQPEETVEMPSANAAGEQAEEPAGHSDENLQQLADIGDDDETLAATLMEALTLLENDYEEDLTASQIIDTDAITKALEEEEEDDGTMEQKLAG